MIKKQAIRLSSLYLNLKNPVQEAIESPSTVILLLNKEISLQLPSHMKSPIMFKIDGEDLLGGYLCASCSNDKFDFSFGCDIHLAEGFLVPNERSSVIDLVFSPFRSVNHIYNHYSTVWSLWWTCSTTGVQWAAAERISRPPGDIFMMKGNKQDIWLHTPLLLCFPMQIPSYIELLH